VPQNGPRHWQSAFLPAVFQGTAFNADRPIPNLASPSYALRNRFSDFWAVHRS